MGLYQNYSRSVIFQYQSDVIHACNWINLSRYGLRFYWDAWKKMIHLYSVTYIKYIDTFLKSRKHMEVLSVLQKHLLFIHLLFNFPFTLPFVKTILGTAR